MMGDGPYGNYSSAYYRSLAAGGSTPLTVTEYTSAVLAATDPSQLNGQNYELDNSTNDWDPTQKNGNFTGAYVDHNSSTLTVIHANYVGPRVTTTLGSLQLPAESMTRLQGHFNATRAAVGMGPIDLAGLASYTLIILGVALLTAAALIAVFAPESGAWVLLFGVALTIGAFALVAGIADAVLEPTLTGTTCNSTSTSCCATFNGIGGENTVCTDCSSGSCTTTSQPSGGPGGLLTSLAWGALALGGVTLGLYVAYKATRSYYHPGDTRSFSQRHPTLAAAPGTLYRGAQGVYRDARSGVGRVLPPRS
jgi:hypothetical protein